MNAVNRGKGSSKSSLARSKLFGALGHVHNPFSTNSHRSHDVNHVKQDESAGSLRTMSLQVEIAKAEALLTAQNLVSRLQKS